MNKEIINQLVETNSYEYNLLKAAEEMQELALALIQKVNKPNKVKDKEITDEIGDVKIRLKILDKLFDSQVIEERIEYKINKFKGYLERGEYKSKI